MFENFFDKKFFRLCIKSGLIGMAISLTIWDKVLYFSGVDGISMQPLINPKGRRKKDRVLILRSFKPLEKNIQRGEVVSLISPKNYDECFIKRVIGLPGDLIKTIDYKKNYVVVPQGHCWIEGDNHNSSYDSNRFGCIPMSLILGKALVLMSPVSYDYNISKYGSEFLNSFRLVKPDLPDNRHLLKLEKELVLKQKKIQTKHNYFIDLIQTKKENEDGLSNSPKLDIQNLSSAKLFIEMIENEEKYGNLYSEDFNDEDD